MLRQQCVNSAGKNEPPKPSRGLFCVRVGLLPVSAPFAPPLRCGPTPRRAVLLSHAISSDSRQPQSAGAHETTTPHFYAAPCRTLGSRSTPCFTVGAWWLIRVHSFTASMTVLVVMVSPSKNQVPSDMPVKTGPTPTWPVNVPKVRYSPTVRL